MAKRALITGITGQDGAYLAQLLLEQGYEVYGGHRRNASVNPWRLDELGVADDITFVDLELLEYSNLMRIIESVRPDELYNLAAQSFVAVSFEQPIYTGEVDALGVTRLLEAIRSINPAVRFYQASTSEMFGNAQEVPQSESTPFRPRSPYAAAKLYAHSMTVNYREAHGLFAVSGILFNHESPLRGMEFVTRKITASLARIRYGQQEVLELGNLDTKRDWGAAPDYVRGIWQMLQQPAADDYVLATGEANSVRSFVERTAAYAGFDLEWVGEGAQTRGVDRKTSKAIVAVAERFFRPSEVDHLIGSARKAKERLGWEPRVGFDQLVQMMAERDLARASMGPLRH